MCINSPKGPIVVVENITWDETARLVTFAIVEHPSHTGVVTNQVEVTPEGQFLLTYTMDWKFQGEGEDPLAAMSIKPAVIKSVQVIEEAAKVA